MRTDSIRVSGVLPARAADVLRAWLDSAAHSAFTGGVAFVEPVVGGRFSAWDGYIEGTTVAIDDRCIVQMWRTSEFPPGSPDSRLEIVAEPLDGGTRLTFVHSNIPEGQGPRYEEGWVRFYLTPMLEYFANVAEAPFDYAETGEFPISGDDDQSVERERSTPPSAKAKAKAPAKRNAKSKADAKTKTSAKTKSIAKTKTVAKSKADAKTKTNANTKAIAKTKTNANTKAIAKTKTNAKPKGAAKTKTNAKTKAIAKTKTKADAKTKTNAKPKGAAKTRAPRHAKAPAATKTGAPRKANRP